MALESDKKIQMKVQKHIINSEAQNVNTECSIHYAKEAMPCKKTSLELHMTGFENLHLH